MLSCGSVDALSAPSGNRVPRHSFHIVPYRRIRDTRRRHADRRMCHGGTPAIIPAPARSARQPAPDWHGEGCKPGKKRHARLACNYELTSGHRPAAPKNEWTGDSAAIGVVVLAFSGGNDIPAIRSRHIRLTPRVVRQATRQLELARVKGRILRRATFRSPHHSAGVHHFDQAGGTHPAPKSPCYFLPWFWPGPKRK